MTDADHLRALERTWAGRLGLELRERMLDVPPVGRARVIECGSGRPVLFVHGGGGLASGWLPLFAELADLHAIAVDRPGCGLTGGHDYTREPSMRAHAVGFLERTMDALGLPSVDLVANSMGALWCLWLALDRPARVKSLAVVGCPALVVGTSAPLPMRVVSRPVLGGLLERPQSPAGMAKVFAMLGHAPEALARAFPEAIPLFAAGANLPGAGASWRSLLYRVLRLRGARPDCALDAPALRALTIRPLALWGAADPFGDLAAARRFADATGARLEIVGRGHLPWLDDPAGVAAHLRRHSVGLHASASTQ